MLELNGLSRVVLLAATLASGAALQQASAQDPTRDPARPPAAKPQPTAVKPGQTMQRFEGVWVEGPGFEVTYGGTYDGCAKRCLANEKCVMIEFYRPEKKCNLYNALRPRLKGGSSDVAIRG